MSIHHFTFLPMFLAISLLAVPVAMVWIHVDLLVTREEVDVGAHLVGLAAALLTVVVLGAVFAALMSRFMPTRVTADGIRGYSVWNLPRAITWDGTRDVRPLRLFGLRFVRIVPTTGWTAIWQPLFLSDPGGFRDAVRDRAGPDHPLTTCLDRALGS